MSGDFPFISSIDVQVFEVPTDHCEADGTLEWNSTTVVLVKASSGTCEGIGWTYAGASSGTVVNEKLAKVIIGGNPMDIPALNEAMTRACRNLGRSGAVACAISAVDIALWDLKSRLIELPLSQLFGRVLTSAPIYGSGGFTTYNDDATRSQLELWTSEWAIPRVKIKIGEAWGSEPKRDLQRVALMRDTIGPEVEAYVDANGGYTAKQAIRMGRRMVEEYGVSWFEEPVSSDNLVGLREVRDQCSADVAAGEYGYSLPYFAHMVDAQAVDCLQVDVTRCGGYTEWLRAAALAHGNGLQVSGHCAPNLHAHVAVAVPNLRHLEYFHDHHRIETMFFDGTLAPLGGVLTPRVDAVGHGLALRKSDAERYRIA